MNNVKDVYYRNTVYKIPYDDLKHVDGYDVAKLPNQVYVYFEELEKKWKLAPQNLIENYAGKRYIDVELNGDLIKCLSYIDLEDNIDNQKLTKVNIECIVIRDETSKNWKIVNKNEPIYQAYMQGKSE